MLLWEARDPFADDVPELVLLGAFGRRRSGVGQELRRGLVDRFGWGPMSREARVAEVQRNAVQPGQRRDVQAQDRAPLVRAGEGVLEDLLGRLRVAGQAVGRPIDRRAVAVEELLEGVQFV